MEHSQLSATHDFEQGAPTASSPLSQSFQHDQPVRLDEDVDNGQPESSIIDNDGRGAHMHHSDSNMSQSKTLAPSRGGTLKKKQSLKKAGSIRRSNSTRSARAGSVKSLDLGEREKYTGGKGDELYSAFFTPVPTTGNPTEILAGRFQAWRKVLKDLITYYRDIQKSYETRSKSLLTLSSIINNTAPPPGLLTEGGINQATRILKDYHKQSVAESSKARTIEEDVIIQLSGLRSDLQQKIKEIKNLAGDFKNAVAKETDGTRKAVQALQEALGVVDTEPGAASGKGDPFILRLSVDRQVERQLDEENYLHRAFLNLENSGRELESIVVGEIQKSYNAYAGILKREAEEAYEAAERLRNGPIAMAKDLEWNSFVDGNENFVNPKLPIRKAEFIHYPGKDAPAAAEVRSGMLERKSKYLKSYTPGWYVLSPTHLHEFKSADRIEIQSPIMSLYLPEQKLGSRSSTDSSSHKFMLKGRQAGGMHRGHGWVFRAESYETMLAWYEDIKNLTEKTGEERNAFVRKHARSFSGGSHKAGSVSSDGALEEDEADYVPYSATTSQFEQVPPQDPKLLKRPQPGGRFPSDINVNRDLRVPLSPSSGTSSEEHENLAVGGPSAEVFNTSKQPSYHLQRDDQEPGEKGKAPRPDAERVEHRDVVPTIVYNPASSGPSRLSSYQVQQDHTAAGRQTSTMEVAGAADMHSATSTEDAGVQPMSGIPMRLSSFQMLHNEQKAMNNVRPVEPQRTMSDDPEAVAAAMALPGTNFPYVQTHASPQQHQVISSSSRISAPGDLPATEYAYHGQNNVPPQNELVKPKINSSVVQEIDSRRVSSYSEVPGRGSEYYSQPVQAQGIVSDAPGAVAYTNQQQNLQVQSSEHHEPHQSNERSTTSRPERAEPMTGAIISNTEPVVDDGNPQRHSEHQIQRPQSEFQIDSPLHEHRERHKLMQEQKASVPEPPAETILTQPGTGDLYQPSKTSADAPTSEPIELGQFGSSPKQIDTNTFEPSFANGTVDSPVSPMSATTCSNKVQATPFRPRPITRVETISDLHVPGEFPNSPPGETSV